MVKKRFYEWIKVKKSLHESSIQKCVKEGEVWWCGMGENVGVEINGKNEEFSRPILVFKKFTSALFKLRLREIPENCPLFLW